jgi:hypothetical protein
MPSLPDRRRDFHFLKACSAYIHLRIELDANLPRPKNSLENLLSDVGASKFVMKYIRGTGRFANPRRYEERTDEAEGTQRGQTRS